MAREAHVDSAWEDDMVKGRWEKERAVTRRKRKERACMEKRLTVIKIKGWLIILSLF